MHRRNKETVPPVLHVRTLAGTEQMKTLIDWLIGWPERVARHLDGVAPLFARIVVGWVFLWSGWGKLHNLDGFAQRFAGWGIPYPYFNAALSAYTEFIGGWLTIIGLGTRLISIPMIINMLVAILKVNLKRVSSIDDFVELDEPLYALAYLWLLLSGPGWVSVDFFVRRVFRLRAARAAASALPAKQKYGLDSIIIHYRRASRLGRLATGGCRMLRKTIKGGQRSRFNGLRLERAL